MTPTAIESKYHPEAIETRIDPTVLLAGVKFHLVDQPTILDHAMEGRAMRTEAFHVDKFKKRCAEAAVVYVNAIVRRDTDPEDVYLFRYSMSDKPLMARLTDEMKVDRVHFSNDLIPGRPVKFVLLLEHLQDLELAWGRDEVARQIGLQILTAVPAPSV